MPDGDVTMSFTLAATATDTLVIGDHATPTGVPSGSVTPAPSGGAR